MTVRQRALRIGSLLLESGVILFVVLFLYPVVLVVYNSFKSYGELILGVIALPKIPTFDNYLYVWNAMEYPRLFLNNVLITSFSVIGIVAISAPAAYKLSRTRTRYSWFLYMFCIVPLIMPFHSIMISLLKILRTLSLSGSIVGLDLIYIGLGAPFAVFVYHGFVKGIPREIDESAKVDGASDLRLFLRIVFPLLRPVTTTIAIINVMSIWNDFFLPFLAVNSVKHNRTLTLASHIFFGQYVTKWNYALAAIVLATLPSVVIFIMMQKHIVKGIVSGAVKG